MGVQYGRLASFVFALCCCMAIVSVVNNAFANDVPYHMKGNGYVPKSVRHSMSNLNNMYHNYYVENGIDPAKWNRDYPRNKTLPTAYSAARVTQIVKTAAKGTAWAVATYAAVEAAGWAIDELTGQVTKETLPEDDNLRFDPNTAWYVEAQPNRYFPDPMTAAKTIYSGSEFCNYTYGEQYSTRQTIRVWYRRASTNECALYSGMRILSKNCPLCNWERDQIKEPQVLPVPQSEYEPVVYDAIRQLPKHQIEQGFKDEQGRPVMTPELQEAIHDWHEELADRNPDVSYNRQTGMFTYNDPDDGTTTEYEVDSQLSNNTGSGTESNQEPLGAEWPSFCDWATVVCDLAEFIMEEPEVPEPEELPIEEINLADYQEEFDSGLGSGSCPAPVSFSYAGYSGNYSFETACFAATNYFRPVILAMAAIMAGFIIVGATRKSI